MKTTTVVLCASLAAAVILGSALTASPGDANPNAVDATDRPPQVSETTGASFDPMSKDVDRGHLTNDVGDVNGDGVIDGDDAGAIYEYLFEGGPAPDPWESADVNCDGQITVADLNGLAGSISGDGTVPGDTNGDGIPDC